MMITDNWLTSPSGPTRYKVLSTVNNTLLYLDDLYIKISLRYDLKDRPGVLGNYVPVNYHHLYDLSVLVEGFRLSLEHKKTLYHL